MDLLRFFASNRSHVLTEVFRIFTLLGEETILIGLICALYWCYNKKLAYGLGISFFVSALVVHTMKITFRVDRPWVLDPSFEPVESATVKATGYSFPSGHTQSAASTYGYLGIASGKRWLLLASLALTALVGFSRIYLGVHTLTDVLVSMALCLLIAFLAHWFIQKDIGYAPLLIAMVCLSFIALLIAYALYAQGTIQASALSDCCTAAGGCIGCAGGIYLERRKVKFSTRTLAFWQQLVKLAVGLSTLWLLKWSTSLLPSSPWVDMFCYCLIALWGLALYPWVFQTVFSRLGWIPSEA